MPNEIMWRAEELRCSFFVTDSDAVPSDSWQSVVGLPPETTISRPREAVSQEVGVLSWPEPAELILKREPFRVDWFLRPMDANPLGLPQILPGLPFPEVGHRLLELLDPWLKLGLPIHRVAIATRLVVQVESLDSARDLIQPRLEFKLPSYLKDFLYRRNEPIASKALADGRGINRIITWSVATRELSVMALAQGQQKSRTYTVASLETDFNTTPGIKQPLSAESTRAVLSELLGLTYTVALGGHNG